MANPTQNFLPRIVAVLIFGGLAMNVLHEPACNASIPVDDRSIDQRDHVRPVGPDAACEPSRSRDATIAHR
jgi:hypothetical protein